MVHMRPRLCIMIALTVAGVLGVAAAPAAASPGLAAAPQAAAAAPPPWQAVTVPSSVASPATLGDVSATGPADAWAVGAEAETGYQQGTPLILHWNGSDWSKVPLPAIAGPGFLGSVSAASPADAWAAGTDAAGAVLLHWNGVRWRAVRFPGSATATVAGVATAPDGGAWLAGSIPNASGVSEILVERWNGRAWHIAATGLGQGSLRVVRLAASGDVWVAGSKSGGAPLIAYGHQGTWTAIPGPPVSQVNDVLAVTSGDVWAAGLVSNTTVGIYSAFICQWNGSTWTTANVPANVLSQDLSISPDNAGQPQWAGAEAGLDPSTTLYAYYDGSAWSSVPGATQLSEVSDANTVTAHIPGTDATWAVGGSTDLTSQGLTPVSPIIEFNPGT
jgi:hypothetical protein